MKSLNVPLIAAFSIAIGAVFGVCMALGEFANEQGVDAVTGQSLPPAATVDNNPVSGPAMIIVVGEADHDFGVMERNETRRHAFKLKNIGDAPAKLIKGDTTCKCTLSELADDVVQPGEVVDVTLEWKPNSFADNFRQSATIETPDDPNNKFIRLEVHGRVIQSVRPIPEEIVLSNVSSNESRAAVVYVYCYRSGDFELQFNGVADDKLQDHFTVEVKPLPEQLVDEEPAAQSGAKVTVTVQPGLPLGPIHQTLHFTSNLEDLPKLDIPIRGTVSGDISVLGSKSLYNSDHRMVTIGGVPRETGGEYRLQLLVKGPFAGETELSVGDVDPADVLQVEVETDNPTIINDGAVRLYPLVIRIPPRSRSISRLGAKDGEGPKFGKIVIQTTHPQDKQVLLYVKFAVEG